MLFRSKGTVTNCTIYNNASRDGGGIYNDSSGTVTNCTVFNNTASRYGGGIYNDSSGTVINCIAWGNNTDIYSGEVKYSCFSGGTTGKGNIAVDPMFVNVSGDDPTLWDLQLQPNSPCIDKGTSEGAPEYDILGVKRPKGAGVDMGAYEFVPPTP